MPENDVKPGNRDEPENLYFGPFRLNRVRRTLWYEGSIVELSPTDLAVLLLLAQNNHRPLNTEELRTAAWHGASVEPNNVHQAISRLRRKMGSVSPNQDYILRTNRGYVLAAEVTGSSPEANVHDSHVSASVSIPSSQHNSDNPGPPARSTVVPSNKWFYVLGAGLCSILLLVVGVIISSLLRSRNKGLPVTAYRHITHDGRPKGGPLFFDGYRVWFREEIRGVWRIVSVAANGGDVLPLELPFQNPYLRDVAPDGSALLLLSEDSGEAKFWSYTLAGGALQLFPPGGDQGAWAPDGKTMAFGDGDSMRLVSAGATTTRKVASNGGKVLNPRWSPDGAHIAFAILDKRLALSTLQVSDRWVNSSKDVARSVGGDQPSGGWTRDGHYLIIAAGAPDKHDLWAIPTSNDTSGLHLGGPVRLTNGPFNWIWPTPGKNAKELFAIGESTRGELVSLSHGAKEWRPYWDGLAAYELDFSHNGQWVAYVDYPNHGLWTVRVDGTERVRLGWPPFEVHQPHWSPDGTHLAFMGKPGAKWHVMTVDVATDKGVELVPEGDDQGVPTWSKDGRSLEYGDWPTTDRQQVMGLHLLELSTRHASLLPESQGLWTVRTSPNGEYAVALRQDSKTLLVSAAGSTQWREILRGVALDGPTWSPDSKYVYLTASNRSDLLRINIMRATVEKLADIRNFPVTHEQWFGVAPDGSALALRAALGQEIFAVECSIP